MEKELGGSEDARIDSLWAQLDKKGRGRIDFKALQDGLKKIKHREHDHNPCKSCVGTDDISSQ